MAGPDFQIMLLDVWREACQHIDIEQSVDTIARILTHRMPLDRLVLLGIDIEHGTLTLRAEGPFDHRRPRPHQSRSLRASDRRLLQSWGRRQEVLQHKPGDDGHDVIALLLGDPIDGSWIAGPLTNASGITGAMLLRAQPPHDFEYQHVRMAQSLIEPMSAAIQNDHRLHELNALREAAEADKRSALDRLGRDELIGSIIGQDGGLKQVMERVALVTRSDMPVLILGETGAGKEVIARAIHEQSPRAKAPFIRVNCGAIPPELIDSELFGHEKGAFTGATASRRGWFERADEGSLLLDEIGELPLPAQVRLLRVLQEGTFERVGAERPISVNVRIIAATHRDLPAMVQSGGFREDLWYRVAGFPIVIPPLRERKQDIPALTDHFAERASRRFGVRFCPPTQNDIELLLTYDWPGNIRELAAVIDRATILGDGQRLELHRALGSSIPTQMPRNSLPTDRPAASTTGSLDDAIRSHIESALRKCHGRVEGSRGAAALLGVNPHTLRSKMRKLGIVWKRYRD